MSWGLNLDKQQLRKKYNALSSAKRRKSISKAELKNKAVTMGEFKRLSFGTGGGGNGEDDEDICFLLTIQTTYQPSPIHPPTSCAAYRLGHRNPVLHFFSKNPSSLTDGA